MKFWLFAIASFVLGTIVGSFLNVCIYRIPRGISLCTPSRSFCPTCHNSLKWRELIPILSWLVLRKRCLQCRAAIPFQYLIVELLTGFLFLILWIYMGFPQSLGFWVLGSILLVATFIDLETLIIPNILTWGGMLTGFILSVAAPHSLGLESASAGILRSLTGAITGFLLLWAVLEGGKWSFGRVRFQWNLSQKFRVFREEKNIRFECGNKIWKGEEMFIRKSDELIIETSFWRTIDGLEGNGTIRLQEEDCLFSAQKKIKLTEDQEISGTATAVIIPREALGWGDVKCLATIGAFIGVPGVLFTLFSASLLGTFVGIWFLYRGCHGGTLIPFAPFLAIGALIWVLGGHTLWNAYFSRLGI